MLSPFLMQRYFFVVCRPTYLQFLVRPHSLTRALRQQFRKMIFFYTAYNFIGFNAKNELHLTEICQS